MGIMWWLNERYTNLIILVFQSSLDYSSGQFFKQIREDAF